MTQRDFSIDLTNATVTSDDSQTHSRLHILGYVIGELVDSPDLVRGTEDVLRDRTAMIDASIRQLVSARNRLGAALEHPTNGN